MSKQTKKTKRPRSFACLSWCAEDVMYRVKGMTHKQAEEFLGRYERQIEESLTERGNDLIDDLLIMDGQKL
jgi:hypothetical protein